MTNPYVILEAPRGIKDSTIKDSLNIYIVCRALIIYAVLVVIYYAIYRHKKIEHPLKKSLIDSLISLLLIIIAMVLFFYFSDLISFEQPPQF